jgi:dTDP-4-amino-4,6-dideoxygalactose transaminase
MKVSITKPFLDDKEIVKVTEVIKSGWLTQGLKVVEFERLFTEYVSSRYAVATT